VSQRAEQGPTESRLGFFDRIADQWDGMADLDHMGPELRRGLHEIGVAPTDSVVDLGCGTGNLTIALTEHLGPTGRIAAVDFSERMLDQARGKTADHRVQWIHADAASLPLDDDWADHVICFSAWPHFPDPDPVIAHVRRVLRPGGILTIWHAISREAVNAIHREVSPAVREDLLAPASEVGELLREAGFQMAEAIDDEARYLIRATLPKA